MLQIDVKKTILLVVVICLHNAFASAKNSVWLEKLDSILAVSENIVAEKNNFAGCCDMFAQRICLCQELCMA